MANRQSRRSFSLSRPVANALAWAAAEAGVTASQFLTELIRKNVADVPDTRHQDRSAAARSLASRERARTTDSKYERLSGEITRIRGVLTRLEAAIGGER